MEKYIMDKRNGDVETAEDVMITDERIIEIIRIVSSDEHVLKWVYDFAKGFDND